MALNGVAVRFYSYPKFRLGAFTSPNQAIRRAAIDITKRAIDRTAELGGDLMTFVDGTGRVRLFLSIGLQPRLG